MDIYRRYRDKICVVVHFSSSITEIWGPGLRPSHEESFQWKDCHSRAMWVILVKPALLPLMPTSWDASPQISQLLYLVGCYQCHVHKLITAIVFLLTTPKLQIKSVQPGITNCFLYLSIFFFFLTWPWQHSWLRATDIYMIHIQQISSPVSYFIVASQLSMLNWE